jgi:transcriptional regulator with XRE-family HTH domain
MTTGERIRAARVERGFSQTELAERLGISKQLLYRYEKNIILNIPLDQIKRIGEILDVSPAYLADFDDFVPEKEMPVTTTGNGRSEEFIALFSQLTAAEKNLVIAQIKGILASR